MPRLTATSSADVNESTSTTTSTAHECPRSAAPARPQSKRAPVFGCAVRLSPVNASWRGASDVCGGPTNATGPLATARLSPPWAGAPPADRLAPADRPTPADRSAPADELAPAERLAPADRLALADRPAPADGPRLSSPSPNALLPTAPSGPSFMPTAGSVARRRDTAEDPFECARVGFPQLVERHGELVDDLEGSARRAYPADRGVRLPE